MIASHEIYYIIEWASVSIGNGADPERGEERDDFEDYAAKEDIEGARALLTVFFLE